MSNGDKYIWAGRIALVCLIALTTTTMTSMFWWPIEGDVLRSTNAVFASVLTFTLGVFTGATRPDPEAARSVVASITGHGAKGGGEEAVTVSTNTAAESAPAIA
jgi:hypothetical protein